MGKQARRRAAASPPVQTTEPVPVVGAREPCPCGSGRRYKACHGRAAAQAAEPTGAAARSRAWPASATGSRCARSCPAATAPLRCWPASTPTAESPSPPCCRWPGPALVRADGSSCSSGCRCPAAPATPAATSPTRSSARWPPSRARRSPPTGLPGPGPRLQDLLDPTAPLDVHGARRLRLLARGRRRPQPRGGRLAGAGQRGRRPDRAAGRRSRPPTGARSGDQRAPALGPAARRGRAARRARPAARRRRRHLGRGHPATSARSGADGLLVPVWDLDRRYVGRGPRGAGRRLRRRGSAEALADTSPLDDAARRARSGLRSRQLTLR